MKIFSYFITSLKFSNKLNRKVYLCITTEVYKEILEGKNKKLMDALLTERLVQEKKIKISKVKNNNLTKKLMQDFNLGIGEAETLALALDKQCESICTDNKQGRKVAVIHNLNLLGSVDITVSLYKLGLIDKDKAVNGLKKLKEFGWFQDYLTDNAIEEIKNA